MKIRRFVLVYHLKRQEAMTLTMRYSSGVVQNNGLLLRRACTKVHVCAIKRDFSSLISRSVNNESSTTTISSSRSFNLWEWYSRMLDTNPILTKCLSAGIITSTGNVLSQKIVHEDESLSNFLYDIDWNQVGRFAVLNMILVTPSLHYWYNFINKAIPGRNMTQVFKRVFYDEFIFTPLYMPIFLSSLWTIEGSNNIPKMLRDEMPNIMCSEWALWVPTMTFTFKFIPVKYQVLLINAVGVVWHTFLSYTAREAHTKSIEASFEGVPTTKTTSTATYIVAANTNELQQYEENEEESATTTTTTTTTINETTTTTATTTTTGGLSRYMTREMQVFFGLAKQ